MQIKGLDSLCKKLNNIAVKLPKTTKESMEELMKDGQKKALDKKRGRKDENMIPYEISSNKKEVIGKLHTDKDSFSHALFEEFGTGTKAEMEHIGKTKTFIESGYKKWYLPKDKAPRDFGDHRLIMIDGQLFYIMFPQSPKPFMRPTAFYLRDTAKIKLCKGIKERINK